MENQTQFQPQPETQNQNQPIEQPLAQPEEVNQGEQQTMKTSQSQLIGKYLRANHYTLGGDSK